MGKDIKFVPLLQMVQEYISQNYSAGDAAVRAVRAGADMVLSTSDFASAHAALLSAAETDPEIAARVEESVRRIVRIKLELS